MGCRQHQGLIRFGVGTLGLAGSVGSVRVPAGV